MDQDEAKPDNHEELRKLLLVHYFLVDGRAPHLEVKDWRGLRRGLATGGGFRHPWYFDIRRPKGSKGDR
jgi:hypothetical protein